MTGNPSSNFELKSFEIDITKSGPTPYPVALTSQTDFALFVRELARKVNSSNATRNYLFKQSPSIKLLIEDILNSGFLTKNTTEIAKCLFNAEVKFSERYKVSDIKQGNLLISRFNIGNDDLLLIAKVDFESFFEKGNFKKVEGLPTEKGLLKSALFKIENGKVPELFKIADSNGSISKFWSDEFLNASPYKSDSENTINAYTLITKSINKTLKNSAIDKIAIINSVISYFNTKSQFNSDYFVKDVIGTYKCEGTTPISDVISAIEELFKTKKFDGNFTIVSSEVRSKMKKTYKLEDDISIVTNQGTKDRIYSKNLSGIKYVLIQSDAGYEQFPELK